MNLVPSTMCFAWSDVGQSVRPGSRLPVRPTEHASRRHARTAKRLVENHEPSERGDSGESYDVAPLF